MVLAWTYFHPQGVDGLRYCPNILQVPVYSEPYGAWPKSAIPSLIFGIAESFVWFSYLFLISLCSEPVGFPSLNPSNKLP